MQAQIRRILCHLNDFWRVLFKVSLVYGRMNVAMFSESTLSVRMACYVHKDSPMLEGVLKFYKVLAKYLGN
jgi:hypothetical protein